MARFVNIQSNFTTGELDPLIRARVDLKSYNNALETAKNVIIQPQGGVKRRPGTQFLFELGGTPENGIRFVHFEFSVDDSYMLIFTTNRMYVIKNRTLITNINASGNNYLDTSGNNLTGANIKEMCWTQSADTLILTHKEFAPVEIVRGVTDADWTISPLTFDSIPKYAFTPAYSNPAGTLTPSAVTGNVTLTASSGVFNSGHVGQYINVSPQGRAKIIKFNSTTVVEAVTEYPFFNTTAIANGSWELETGYENVWSVSRGWPRTTTFHQGRLFFGGSKARPSTVWGSKVGLFFDFEGDEGLDDDAVEATLDTNTFNAITDIQSGRDLQLFTTGGEFYVPQEGLNPITPADFFFNSSSANGSREGIRVKKLESGMLFVQRQGKTINEIAYSDVQLTYMTTKISLLAGHLLKNPKSIDLRKAVATDENDLLFIINEDDGTMAVFSLLKAQDVIAASQFTTTGDFIDVGVDITDIYVATKRDDNGVDKYYLEVFDDNTFTDCAKQGGAVASLDMSHIDGATVNVISDGYVELNQTADNTVTFVNTPTTSCEVGLPIDVQIVTMPVDLAVASGTRLGFRKRIAQVNALLYKTQNIKINNNLVPIRSLGAGALGSPVPEFTGTKKLYGILGYSNEGKITVTQTAPLKLTLLGLDYRVSVTQEK
jgi:hypothetical protein